MPSDIRPIDKIMDKSSIEHICQMVTKLLEAQTKATTAALPLVLQALDLLDRKQQMYGPKNVTGFGDFGIVVRMNDKFERLKTMYQKNGRTKARIREGIDDALFDILNYCLIALMVRQQTWPTE